jgi:hypothetical protein
MLTRARELRVGRRARRQGGALALAIMASSVWASGIARARDAEPKLAPSLVDIDLCSNKPSFSLHGKRRHFPNESPRDADLREIASTVKAAGLTSVTIRSRCWLTADGVRGYCSVFSDAGVRVNQLVLPKSGPLTDNLRTCTQPGR